MNLDVTRLLVLSALAMGMSHTIARERLFAPLRDRLGGKETWIGYLVSCPYCASHWVAFGLVALSGPLLADALPPWGALSVGIDWFLSSILVATVAAFLRVAFYFVDEGQGLVRRRQREVEEEAALHRVTRREHEQRLQ